MQVVRSEQLSILCTIKRSKARCLLMPNMAEEKTVLYYALVFLLVALIAGVLGFWAVAGIAATVAKILFFVFLIIFIVSLVSHISRRA